MKVQPAVLTVAAAAVAEAALQSTAAQEPAAQHVVMLLADQLRYDGLGPWSPNLNRIAAQGVSFTKAYSSTPTCTPARAALLTGLSP